MENGSAMKVKSIAECSPRSILQYFWPTLSNYRYWKIILVLFSGDRLRQVLLYVWPGNTTIDDYRPAHGTAS